MVVTEPESYGSHIQFSFSFGFGFGFGFCCCLQFWSGLCLEFQDGFTLRL